jgi:hypothetical protein
MLLRSSKITASLHVYIMHTRKDHPIVKHQGPNWEWKHSSALSLTSAVGVVWGSTPHPRSFTPRERQSVPNVQVVAWVPGTVLTGEEILAPTDIPTQDSSFRSKSLYRLRYPG